MSERLRRWFSWVKPQSTTAINQPVYDGPRCPHCDSIYYVKNPILERRLVNPNGEYVEGYGHAFVIKQKVIGAYYSCAACGWDSRKSEVIITREQMGAL